MTRSPQRVQHLVAVNESSVWSTSGRPHRLQKFRFSEKCSLHVAQYIRGQSQYRIGIGALKHRNHNVSSRAAQAELSNGPSRRCSCRFQDQNFFLTDIVFLRRPVYSLLRFIAATAASSRNATNTRDGFLSQRALTHSVARTGWVRLAPLPSLRVHAR